MSGRAWYASLPDISVEIDVEGGACHRVTWRRGRLRLHDHDLAAEEVLGALGGGPPCACMYVLQVLEQRTEESGRQGWRRRQSGLVGVRGARGHIRDILTNPRFANLSQQQRQRTLAFLYEAQLLNELPEFRSLVSMTEALRDTCRQRRGRPAPPTPPRDADVTLRAAAVPALQDAIRRSRRDLRPYASISIDVRRRPPGEERLLTGTLSATDGTLTTTLPASWLNRIWARGAALVDGHFILDVEAPAPATTLAAQALHWQRRRDGRSVPTAVPCLLVRAPTGWELRW